MRTSHGRVVTSGTIRHLFRGKQHVCSRADDDAVVAVIIHQNGSHSTRRFIRNKHVGRVNMMLSKVLARVGPKAVVADFRHHSRASAQHGCLHALIRALLRPTPTPRLTQQAKNRTEPEQGRKQSDIMRIPFHRSRFGSGDQESTRRVGASGVCTRSCQ